MFVKNGDGKILSVVETDEMTEEQKKTAKKVISEKTAEQTETNEKKDSGR